MGNHRGIRQNKEIYLYGHCIIQTKVIFFEAKYKAVSVAQARYYLCLGLKNYFQVGDFLNPVVYESGRFPSTLYMFRTGLPTNDVRCFYDWNYINKIEVNTNLHFTNAYSSIGYTDEQIKNTSRDYIREVVQSQKEACQISIQILIDEIERRKFRFQRSNINKNIESFPYVIYDMNNQIVLNSYRRREVVRFKNYIKYSNLNDGVLA